MLTSHPQSWLVVALIIIIGASVRHFLNRHDAGEPLYKIAWALPVATVALGAALYATAPRSAASFMDVQVTDDDVFRIVGSHCVMCHTQFPSREGFDAPPKGVVLGTLDEVLRHKDAVLAQAVFGNAMPLGNENGMTEAERNQLGAWLLRH
jgi:uncharacterized membrane protein